MKRNASTPTPAALLSLAGVFFVTAASANPLAGPEVEGKRDPASLIERNIDGTMRRHEIPVAEAAVQLVDLTEAERAPIKALLSSRAAKIDAIVKANMRELTALRGSRAQATPPPEAGEGEAPRRRARETRRAQFETIMKMFEPVLKEGPLEDQIADLLPETKQAAYREVIAEHRAELAADRRARRGGGDAMQGEMGEMGERRRARRGPPPGDDGAMLFEEERPDRVERGERARGEGQQRSRRAGAGRAMAQMGELRLEIRRSIQRLSADRQETMDDLYERLDLDAETEPRVRALLEQLRQVRNEPNGREARREIMTELAEILTPEQAQVLREMRPDRGQRQQRRRGQPPADEI